MKSARRLPPLSRFVPLFGPDSGSFTGGCTKALRHWLDRMLKPTILAALFLLTCLLVLLTPARAKGESAAAGSDEFQFDRVTVEDQDFGYVLKKAVWKFSRGEKIIFVCWEELEDGFSQEREWVRSAVSETWQRHSALKFEGWGLCAERNAGIRIRVSDTPTLNGPHVKKLGSFLDDMPEGMVLNFTFNHWSHDCKSTREYCIRAIAVHEFGHALALAHEQNRHDAPGECQLLRQGSDGDLLLTPYDAESVMNYCNKKYNNDGKLSEHDIETVQELYCAPEEPNCEPLS